MARGLFRKTSFNKMVGAYRSQWKRFWMRLFTFGMYGRKGMGWWRDPKKAWYNWWYHRTSISIPRLLGYRPSRFSFFCAMLCASVISIFAAPVDATRAGVTAHKIKKERKARAEGTSTRTARPRSTSGTSSPRTSSYSSSERTSTRTYTEPKSTSSAPRASSTRVSGSMSSTTRTTTSSPKTTRPQKTTTTSVKITPPVVEEKKQESYNYSFTTLFPKTEPTSYVPPKPDEPTEPDENTPKSTPMNEGDQYIRKRMIIAGSFYCDQAVVSQLTAGTYFELIAEPDNPHDKDAVALYYKGSKIGYVPKKDVTPFVVCLKLRRNIYGVVTEIREKDGRKEIEFETWFSSKR